MSSSTPRYSPAPVYQRDAGSIAQLVVMWIQLTPSCTRPVSSTRKGEYPPLCWATSCRFTRTSLKRYAPSTERYTAPSASSRVSSTSFWYCPNPPGYQPSA